MKGEKEQIIEKILNEENISFENEISFKKGASKMYENIFGDNLGVIDAYENGGRIFLDFGARVFELTKKEALELSQMIIISVSKTL